TTELVVTLPTNSKICSAACTAGNAPTNTVSATALTVLIMKSSCWYEALHHRRKESLHFASALRCNTPQRLLITGLFFHIVRIGQFRWGPVIRPIGIGSRASVNSGMPRA